MPRLDPKREKRDYIRLKTVFPVLFQVVSEDKKEFLSESCQGFTKDISSSGICISANNVKESLIDTLKNNRNCKLLLTIEMPFFIKPINAVGNVVWMEKSDKGELKIHLIGVEYEEILLEHQRKIIRNVKLMRDIPKITAAAIVVLLIILGIMTAQDLRLREKNSALIERLNKKSSEELTLRQDLIGSNDIKTKLTQKFNQVNEELALLNEKNRLLEDSESKEKENLQKQLDNTQAIKKEYQYSLARVNNENEILKKHLNEIKESKNILRDRIFEAMYHYIKALQNKNTGLIPSFKGDPTLLNCAFTYDQALAACLFIIRKDYKNAEKILDFYHHRAKKSRGIFYNGYFSTNGDIAEYTAHVGPSVFIGLAALQYTKDTKSKKYLPLAESIANEMIKLQSENKKGAVRGAIDVSWISTEHNLDVYALFAELYKVTQKKEYSSAQGKVLRWIVESGYNRGIHGFNRGNNDAHVATDANILSILSLGPKKLYEEDIDPRKIIDFVERRCKVKVKYTRTDNTKILVEGFDFTDPKIVRRQPAISCEWTAQAIVAYKIMADYFEKEGELKVSQEYREKADYYMTELEKVAIVKGGIIRKKGIGFPLLIMALPYASRDRVDTGHGWVTPQGAQTTSIASTIYVIFSHEGYNCFKLNFLD